MSENEYVAIALAIVLGPLTLVGVLIGAHSEGWRGALLAPLRMWGGLVAFVLVLLFLKHVVHG